MSRSKLGTKATTDPLIPKVQGLARNPSLIKRLHQLGLTIELVKWEDTARSKNSYWGPNICDVMLDVDEFVFPMIGMDNFHDYTLDMDIQHFKVWVGNERTDAPLTPISFQEYLENLHQYIASPVMGPMFLERDAKIVTAGQCCILPLRQNASKMLLPESTSSNPSLKQNESKSALDSVSFNVMINNHQVDATDPAVLVIVASPHGTSAQLLTEPRQRIYFNKNGDKASYYAERLREVRKAAGVSTKGNMSEEEQENNALFVFQIPLLQAIPLSSVRKAESSEESEADVGDCGLFGGGDDYLCDSDEEHGMDHAQLRVGEAIGKWPGTNPEIVIQRDPRYPIRCTIQYYRVTDTADIPDITLAEIASQVRHLYDSAPISDKGSLVIETNPARVTEPELPSKSVRSYDLCEDWDDY